MVSGWYYDLSQHIRDIQPNGCLSQMYLWLINTGLCTHLCRPSRWSQSMSWASWSGLASTYTWLRTSFTTWIMPSHFALASGQSVCSKFCIPTWLWPCLFPAGFFNATRALSSGLHSLLFTCMSGINWSYFSEAPLSMDTATCMLHVYSSKYYKGTCRVQAHTSSCVDFKQGHLSQSVSYRTW